MAKNRRKREKRTAPGGEMTGYAFIYWNEMEERYELKINNKLIGYTSGEDKAEHEIGKETLGKMVKVKGYKVVEA